MSKSAGIIKILREEYKVLFINGKNTITQKVYVPYLEVNKYKNILEIIIKN